jgi:hypothetical protein
MPVVMDELATRLLEDFDETEHLDLRPTLTGARLIALFTQTDGHTESLNDQPERLITATARADGRDNGHGHPAS